VATGAALRRIDPGNGVADWPALAAAVAARDPAAIDAALRALRCQPDLPQAQQYAQMPLLQLHHASHRLMHQLRQQLLRELHLKPPS
jgi:hypothetical protein